MRPGKPVTREAECPNCGNPVRARIYDDAPQKCKWCRRMFKAKTIRRGRKLYIEAEPAAFETAYTRQKP